MLTRYKKNMEKIAMGLLSFMPEEKDVKKLQETIHTYETNEQWHLYVWREEAILGVIGLKLDNNQAIIQHLSVNPSHRNTGLGTKMVQAVKEKYRESYNIQADEQVDAFFKRCMEEVASEEQDKED